MCWYYTTVSKKRIYADPWEKTNPLRAGGASVYLNLRHDLGLQAARVEPLDLARETPPPCRHEPRGESHTRLPGRALAPSEKTCLAPSESFVDLVRVEAHDDCVPDHGHRSGHSLQLLEFLKGCWIPGYIPVRERNTFLRKILFRLLAEHSAGLRKYYYLWRHISTDAARIKRSQPVSDLPQAPSLPRIGVYLLP